MASRFSALTHEERFPIRPGYGSRGRPITLLANYVEMILSDLTLYRYHISVDAVPVSPSSSPGTAPVGKKLTQIIRLFLDMNLLAPIRHHLVTDFKSTLISCQKLKSDSMDLEVPYRTEEGYQPTTGIRHYRLRLVQTGTLELRDLIDYLSSTSIGFLPGNLKLEFVSALNIVLGQYVKASSEMVMVGSNRSFPIGHQASVFSLEGGLTAVRGFFSSVRLATGRVLVNINVSYSAFYNTGDLIDLIRGFGANSDGLHRLQSFLKRVRIQPIHNPRRKGDDDGKKLEPKIRTIFGLANVDDGVPSMKNPPIVQYFGAGPDKVKFWRENTEAPRTSESGSGGKTQGRKVLIALQHQYLHRLQDLLAADTLA